MGTSRWFTVHRYLCYRPDPGCFVLDMSILAIRGNADSSIQVETSEHLLRLDAHSMEFKSRDLDAISGDHDPKRDSPSSGHSIKDKTFVCPQCASQCATMTEMCGSRQRKAVSSVP